ncbi:hypothetical protein RHGRI_032184 [Rhododendron griersonianum]|uniref:Serine aminopeptidase S33 domain-containing protein n=1 Tax=Rhododendron griersonianum TaxID=479676 RepID=A0AAV6IB23_9ERIC|nr:hypothetical protein RHGRI_032184 [Rhododendron griersonianum]
MQTLHQLPVHPHGLLELCRELPIAIPDSAHSSVSHTHFPLLLWVPVHLFGFPLRFPRDSYHSRPFHRVQRSARVFDLQFLLRCLPRSCFQVSNSPWKDICCRYLTTPWLSSPHIQTAFLSLFDWRPAFHYRSPFRAVSQSLIVPEASLQSKDTITEDDKTPIVVVIPGLTSDSAHAYVKHCAFKMAKCGWNVVVSNHRGLGGISITSDCFYNAGWTEDIRKVIDHLHHQFPEAPLFVVGTSIGANVLVKYLGEDGINSPIAGAAAICSPWDLLICDRFINRRAVQKFYNKALTFGLKGYAQLHQLVLSRLADWEGILKSRSVRDFDNYATRVLGKFETVDAYYRHSSSSTFVGNVMVPLLCISSLDDPVCTREAIPWDECRCGNLEFNSSFDCPVHQHIRMYVEHSLPSASIVLYGKHEKVVTGSRGHCKNLYSLKDLIDLQLSLPTDWYHPIYRANKNIVLATTRHGGHLAYYQGITAKSLWWVGAVHEFFSVLHSSSLIRRKKEPQMQSLHLISPPESSIDQGPYLNITEDGMVAAVADEQTNIEEENTEPMIQSDKNKDVISETQGSDRMMGERTHLTDESPQHPVQDVNDIILPKRRYMDQLSRQSRKSIWLLAYIAIVTTWPLVGPALTLFFKKRFRNVLAGISRTAPR